MIVIVFGLPGSGKTYFASKLAAKIHGVHISSDHLRERLQRRVMYQEQPKMEVYHEMLTLMEKAAFRKNVVLDATFYKEDIRNLFIEKAKALKINLYFIEMRADESIIRERVSKKRKGTDADFDVYLRIKNTFQPFMGNHLILDSGREELNEMLNKAEQYIEYRNGLSPGQQTHEQRDFS
jgi:predicted kinase